MATKTTIEMAEACGIPEFENNESQTENIMRFAELVRADERARMAEQPAPVKEPATSAAKGAIMGAAYDFRDAHLSGSTNLKRSAHAKLESAVDAALAEQPAPVQQEPFGYFKAEPFGWTDCAETDEGAVALYDRLPAQRTWVGLTEPERLACYDLNPARFASAIESKLRSKNERD